MRKKGTLTIMGLLGNLGILGRDDVSVASTPYRQQDCGTSCSKIWRGRQATQDERMHLDSLGPPTIQQKQRAEKMMQMQGSLLWCRHFSCA